MSHDQTMRICRSKGMAAFVARYGVGVGVGIVGTIALFHGLFGKPIDATLWGNNLDPNLIVWIVEWVYHTVFERGAPFDVWNSNAYYPHPKSLAFADSMFAVQLVYAPLRALNVAPLPALYAALAAFCIGACVISDRLLQRYNFNAGERALTIAIAHFSLPMTAFLPAHYQLFGLQLAPPLLLTLHQLLNKWRGNDLLLLTILFCLAGCFATYVVPMFGLVVAILVLVCSVRLFSRLSLRQILDRLGWKAILGCVGILSIFFVVQLLPYLSLFGTLPPQKMGQTFVYSARPWSILMHPSSYSMWYEPSAIDNGYWERAAFPGWPIGILAIVGFAVSLLRPSVLDREAKPVVPLAIFAVAVFVITWVLSWGPWVALFGTRIPFPFLYLAQVVPGVENIRAPGRFAQFYSLPLGLFAVASVRMALAGLPRFLPIIPAALAAIVIFDQLTTSPTYDFGIKHEAFYRSLESDSRGENSAIAEGEPLLVLPVVGENHIETWGNRIQLILSTTILWPKVVVGVGSRDTQELVEFSHLDRLLKEGEIQLSDMLAFAQRLNIKKVLIFPGDYAPEARSRILEQAKTSNFDIVLDAPDAMILSEPEK